MFTLLSHSGRPLCDKNVLGVEVYEIPMFQIVSSPDAAFQGQGDNGSLAVRPLQLFLVQWVVLKFPNDRVRVTWTTAFFAAKDSSWSFKGLQIVLWPLREGRPCSWFLDGRADRSKRTTRTLLKMRPHCITYSPVHRSMTSQSTHVEEESGRDRRGSCGTGLYQVCSGWRPPADRFWEGAVVGRNMAVHRKREPIVCCELDNYQHEQAYNVFQRLSDAERVPELFASQTSAEVFRDVRQAVRPDR